MSAVIAGNPVDKNGLPEDIFSYNHDQFYDYIKQTRGDDIAELFSFQAIRNGTHLLASSRDDILAVLQQESHDLNNLKKMCCFKVNGDKYEVKLGVKLAVNSLIELLKIKQGEKQKKKRSSTTRTSSSLNTTTFTNQTQLSNEVSPPSSTLLGPLSNDTSAILFDSSSETPSNKSKARTIPKNLNEMDHKFDIEQRINKWWDLINEVNGLSLDEGTNYFVKINKSMNNTYTCVLSCQCRNRFQLSFIQPGLFKLSSFYRHIKEKQCNKRSTKVSVFQFVRTIVMGSFARRTTQMKLIHLMTKIPLQVNRIHHINQIQHINRIRQINLQC